MPTGKTENISVSATGNRDTVAGLNDDALGFRPYVTALYSYLKNEETKAPFTISIEGEWGSGKSSFMKQLEESLDDEFVTVHFNVWRHDKVESMWAAFALHFIKELLHKHDPWPRIWLNFKLRWNRFRWIKEWFSVVKMLVLLGFYVFLTVLFFKHGEQFAQAMFKDDNISFEAIVPVFGGAALLVGFIFLMIRLFEVTGNPFKIDLQKFINKPNYEGNITYIEEFLSDLEKTVETLTVKDKKAKDKKAEDKKKVFIFIDDLDRAEIPKAAELMQGLNMMITDNSQLIFIVGMDREKVAVGIAAKYKELLPFLYPATSKDEAAGISFAENARSFGYQFLEKFIQLSFQIPRPSKSSVSQYISSLSQLTNGQDNSPVQKIKYHPVYFIADGKDDASFREVVESLAPYFDYNPRRIKQFVNIFRLKAHIAEATGLFLSADGQTESLTIPQLGKFVALNILYPEFIELLSTGQLRFNDILSSQGEFLSSANKYVKKSILEILQLMPARTYSAEYNMVNVDVKELLLTATRPDTSSIETYSEGTLIDSERNRVINERLGKLKSEVTGNTPPASSQNSQVTPNQAVSSSISKTPSRNQPTSSPIAKPPPNQQASSPKKKAAPRAAVKKK